MKRTNKKGFTMVELVIVIVVIAILAAVLIPTFISLTRKANIASDTAVAKNLNTVAIGAQADTFDEAIEAAKEAGYLIANLNAKASDCYFVWEDDSNQFLLYDLKDEKVIYSNTEDYGEIDSSWCFVVSDPAVAAKVMEKLPGITVKQAVATIKNLKEWISKGGSQTIYVDESFNVDSQEQIAIESGEITIKLIGSTVAGSNDDEYAVENIPFYVNGGTLNLEGGSITATGSWLDSDGDPVDSAVLAESGTLNLTDTVVDGTGKNIVLAYAGADGTISGSTIKALSSAINVGGGSNVIVDNCKVEVENEAVWVSTSGNPEGVSSSATVKSGTYSGIGNVIALHGGSVIIEGGEFSAVQSNMFRFYATGSAIIIEGGTFTTADGTYTFSQLNETILKGMMSTSSAGNVTVVKNQDGSFTISN